MKNSNDAMALALSAMGADRTDKGGNPYVRHLIAVAAEVEAKTQYSDDEAVCAAILHDTVEDTDADLDALRAHGFSERVIALVDALTKRSTEKPIDYWLRIVDAGPVACLIKAADAQHNSKIIRLNREPTPKDLRSEAFYIGLSWMMSVAHAHDISRKLLTEMLLDNEARGLG